MSQTMAKLERRARVLLRVYPAEYRRDRAEEIIGTLLEATPVGRSFPSARDAWALIAGGRHARAARNRGLSARANLRLALLLGISVFLSTNIAFAHVNEAPWLTTAAAVLGTAAILAPWLGSRTATAVLVIPAVALTTYEPAPYLLASGEKMRLAMLLIAMGALIVLSGGSPRLPRSWAWLPCAVPAAVMAGHGAFVLEDSLYEDALLLLAVVVVCWLVTDARPAFGLCVAALMTALVGTLTQLARTGWLDTPTFLEYLLIDFAIITPVMLPATWLLLRRQTVPSPLRSPDRNG